MLDQRECTKDQVVAEPATDLFLHINLLWLKPVAACTHRRNSYGVQYIDAALVRTHVMISHLFTGHLHCAVALKEWISVIALVFIKDTRVMTEMHSIDMHSPKVVHNLTWLTKVYRQPSKKVS